MEVAAHRAREITETAQVRIEQAESNTRELQTRLDDTVRAIDEAAQARQAELVQARQTARELEARLESAERQKTEVAAATQIQLQQHQAIIADLQVRLEAGTQAARAEAETSAGRLRDAEQENHKLRARLNTAEPAEARVSELTNLLQEAMSELRSRPEAAAREPDEPAAAAKKAPADNPEPFGEPPADAPVEPPAASSSAGAEPTLAVVENLAKATSAKPPKRKKARDHNQMDLFGESLATDQPAAILQADAPTPAAANEGSNPPTTEISPATLASAPAESAVPVGESMGESMDRPNTSPDQLPDVQSLAAAEDAGDAMPVSVPGLPAVEGLDTAAGLARSEGNPQRYRKALRHFAEHTKASPERIRDALVQGDTEAAQRRLQVLRTSADDIGATLVQSAVADLARVIDDAGDPGEIELVWAELEQAMKALVADLEFELSPKEAKPAPARALPAPPPLHPGQLRRAINQILPLFTGQDPGAQDCLKANRATFRSAFTAEAFAEFEHCVKSGDYSAALEHLKKAGKKHGVSV